MTMFRLEAYSYKDEEKSLNNMGRGGVGCENTS